MRKKVAQLGGKRRRTIMQRVAHRDGGWRCFYCGKALTPVADIRQPTAQNDTKRPTLDHVTARAHGGRNSIDNFVLACVDCNSRKSDGSPA